MHKHNKKETCEHKLDHCNECDVVYCIKCQKEWGKEKIVYKNFPSQVNVPYTNPFPLPITLPAPQTVPPWKNPAMPYITYS